MNTRPMAGELHRVGTQRDGQTKPDIHRKSANRPLLKFCERALNKYFSWFNNNF